MNRKQRRAAGRALKREWRRGLSPAEEERQNREQPPMVFDFSSRWVAVPGAEPVLDVTGLTEAEALGYHTAAAAFLARDGAYPQGVVEVPCGTFDRLNRGMLAWTLAGG